MQAASEADRFTSLDAAGDREQISAALGTVQLETKKPVSSGASVRHAPLVVHPFGEEPYADVSTNPHIEWDKDLEDQARCSLSGKENQETCRQQAGSLSVTYGRVLLSLMAIATVCALPRCIALALSRLGETVPLTPDTGKTFTLLWSSCAHDAAYTGFSVQGGYAKILVGSDHFFGHAGLSIAVVSAHYATFPTQTTRAGKMIMLGFSGLEIAAAIIAFALAVALLNQDSVAAVGPRSLILDMYAVVLAGMWTAGQFCMAGHSRSTSEDRRTGTTIVLGSFYNRLKIVGVAIVLMFYARIVGNGVFVLPDFQSFLARFGGWHSAVVLVLPLVFSQVLLFILRFVYERDETVGWMPPCLLTFTVQMFTSIAVRKTSHGIARDRGGDVGEILYKAVVMLAVDAAAHTAGHALVRHAERRLQQMRDQEVNTDMRASPIDSSTPHLVSAAGAAAPSSAGGPPEAEATPRPGGGALDVARDDISPAPSAEVHLSLEGTSSKGTPPLVLPSPAVQKQKALVRRMRERLGEALMAQMLADVFCVLALSGQDLAVPDYVHWGSLENLKNSTGRTLAGLVVEMAVLAVGHWLLVLAFYLKMPELYIQCFRKITRTKMVLLFCCGLMVQCSINFWPKCMFCDAPTNCLLYLECAATGQVSSPALPPTLPSTLPSSCFCCPHDLPPLGCSHTSARKCDTMTGACLLAHCVLRATRRAAVASAPPRAGIPCPDFFFVRRRSWSTDITCATSTRTG